MPASATPPSAPASSSAGPTRLASARTPRIPAKPVRLFILACAHGAIAPRCRVLPHRGLYIGSSVHSPHAPCSAAASVPLHGPLNEMKPGFECVQTHLMSGFISFVVAFMLLPRLGTMPQRPGRGRVSVTSRRSGTPEMGRDRRGQARAGAERREVRRWITSQGRLSGTM